MIIDHNAWLAIADALRLPMTGREQDWDLELADAARLPEFVDYFEATDLSYDERRALMALMIASLDDWIADGTPAEP